MYAEADADPAGWWKARALEEIAWYHEPSEGLDDSNPPFYKWFADGDAERLGQLPRPAHRRPAAATRPPMWIGEPGEDGAICYLELRDEVAQCANALKALGVERGDRVAIYMGMVPELPIAMLACTRIGAAHSVVFGGFSSTALADRIDDAACKVLITATAAGARARSCR